MAELAYQVDEMLFKMNALIGGCGLPEKPPQDFTDSDTTYGMGEDVSSSGSEVKFVVNCLFVCSISSTEVNCVANCD